MPKERIHIHPGDLMRCPDRPTARWHKVVRVGRHKDGSRYITLRRGRLWRALGYGPLQRLEWASVKALGYGLRKSRSPASSQPDAPQADALDAPGLPDEAKG